VSMVLTITGRSISPIDRRYGDAISPSLATSTTVFSQNSYIQNEEPRPDVSQIKTYPLIIVTNLIAPGPPSQG